MSPEPIATTDSVVLSLFAFIGILSRIPCRPGPCTSRIDSSTLNTMNDEVEVGARLVLVVCQNRASCARFMRVNQCASSKKCVRDLCDSHESRTKKCASLVPMCEGI